MGIRNVIWVLLAAAFLALPGKAAAAESFDSCTNVITTLPATISKSGTWCLKQDLTTSALGGTAIMINANDVTLDCNGYKIDGANAGVDTKMFGIRGGDRLNVTVRHCMVRGFYVGMYLYGANGGGHLVEDNRFDVNRYIGMQVEGDGSIARRNIVTDTGGSTALNSFGIYGRYTMDLLDNTVSTVFIRAGLYGATYGIYATDNLGGSVSGNRVRQVLKAGTGSPRALQTTYSGRITVQGNDLIGNGSAARVGLGCHGTNSRARNNVISGFTTAMSNCGDAGGNDVSP